MKKMNLKLIAEEQLDCSIEHFLKAVDILIRKPHSVNKKLKGAMILSVQGLEDGEMIEDSGIIFDQVNSQVVRKLVHRDEDKSVVETVLFSRLENDDVHLKFKSAEESFEIIKQGPQLQLFVGQSLSKEAVGATQKFYFRPLLNWTSNDLITPSATSIRLVPLDEYSLTYQKLKDKYVKKIAEDWEESTDPEKFVHEDVAIATYLIMIWEEEMRDKQTLTKPRFLDLGCGNGLLVYILNCEGFPGTGLDLRKRKIWDKFGDIDLKVQTIMPSVETTYSGYDWLIGNHSDELTPWIPIMAAMTSAETKFFVLPCCPFELTRKFQRTNSRKSMYRDYLDYVIRMGEKCGFVMEEDRLKIPSTKRICFVGRKLNYKPCESERERVLGDIKSMAQVKEVGGSENPNKKLKMESETFVPRDSVIKVRNCTQIPKVVTDKIIDLVVKECLSVENLLKSSTSKPVLPVGNPDWNMGQPVPLSEVASRVIEPELMQELKSEHGGLSTLFRNKNFIFIVDRGCVRLRCHALDLHSAGKRRGKGGKKGVGIEERFKKKICWFFQNHPDGCPVKKEDCSWAHGSDDLKNE